MEDESDYCREQMKITSETIRDFAARNREMLVGIEKFIVDSINAGAFSDVNHLRYFMLELVKYYVAQYTVMMQTPKGSDLIN